MKSASELLGVLANQKACKPMVLGDVMLDRYTWGDVERISPEAPVPVLRVRSRETRLGGAANVCGNLSALGAQASCVGVVGDDSAGSDLKDALRKSGVCVESLIVHSAASTTVKERFLGHSHSKQANHVLRVDDESHRAAPSNLERAIIDQVEARIADHDVLVISDYGKGVCSHRVLRECVAIAKRHGVGVLVDPSPRTDFEAYRGVDLIKPNRKEAGSAAGLQLRTAGDAVEAAGRLCSELELGSMVITLDRDGMVHVDNAGGQTFVPVKAQTVCDVTGAGDAVFAMLALCFTSKLPPESTLELCNLVGELAIERMGAVSITFNDLRRRLMERRGVATLDEIVRRVAEHRSRGQRVVFTNGCFDLMHIGHVRYLSEAAEMGDVLVVGVNSDASVRRLKGKERPVIGENDRSAMLSALQCVDYVAIYDEDTPHMLLEAIRPDVLVKGGTYSLSEVVGREVVEAYGGEVRLAGAIDGISTTRIIDALREGSSTAPAPMPIENVGESLRVLENGDRDRDAA